MLSRSLVRISLEAKHLQHLSAQLIHYISLHIYLLCESASVSDLPMMFVKLYVRTNFACILGSIRLSLANEIDAMH